MKWADASLGAAINAMRHLHLFKEHYLSLASGPIRDRAVAMLSPQQTGKAMRERLVLLHQCLCITGRLREEKIDYATNTLTNDASSVYSMDGSHVSSCVDIRQQLQSSSSESFLGYCKQEVLGQRTENYPFIGNGKHFDNTGSSWSWLRGKNRRAQ